MFNWLTQIRIKMIPTIENWSDFGIVEVKHPDDFFSVGYDGGLNPYPQIKGIICPIPEAMLPDKNKLSSYYNAVQTHQLFHHEKELFGDTTNRVVFNKGLDQTSEGNMPPELVALERMLSEAFSKTTDEVSYTTIYQVNSNYHRTPEKHSPSAIITVDGPTTIMFAENARGKLVGKKSLPQNSMAVFLGMHAAPDTGAPRLNILVG